MTLFIAFLLLYHIDAPAYLYLLAVAIWVAHILFINTMSLRG